MRVLEGEDVARWFYISPFVTESVVEMIQVQGCVSEVGFGEYIEVRYNSFLGG